MLYYVAFRIHALLEKHLPFAKGFKAPGVRDARNKLIEHPEKDDGIVPRTVLVDVEGPKIKAVRAEGVELDRRGRVRISGCEAL
jgi:hypothetical protein